jgi:hypothetical protein
MKFLDASLLRGLLGDDADRVNVAIGGHDGSGYAHLIDLAGSSEDPTQRVWYRLLNPSEIGTSDAGKLVTVSTVGRAAPLTVWSFPLDEPGNDAYGAVLRKAVAAALNGLPGATPQSERPGSPDAIRVLDNAELQALLGDLASVVDTVIVGNEFGGGTTYYVDLIGGSRRPYTRVWYRLSAVSDTPKVMVRTASRDAGDGLTFVGSIATGAGSSTAVDFRRAFEHVVLPHRGVS